MTTDAVAQSEIVTKPNAFLINKVQITREQTVANIMRQFRQYAGDDNVLEENESNKFDEVTAARNRAGSMRQLMQFDYNGDGSITREELEPKKSTLFLNWSVRSSRANDVFTKLDANKDGDIELLEAYRSLVENPNILKRNKAAVQRYQIDSVENYLDLVPKGQPRKLTADTLEEISREAFAYFDTDGDGVLRGDEQERWQKERRAALLTRFNNLSSNLSENIASGLCSLPKPGPRDEVFLIALNKSNRQSNLSLQDTSAQTGLFTLHIEPGDKPIYAMVHTSKPTVIRVTGDTQRVSHLVNVTAQGGGVYDFDKTKVTFDSAADCFNTFTNNASARATLAKSVIKGLIGRRVNRTISSYSMDRLTLPSAIIDKCSSSLKKRNDKAHQSLCGMPEWFQPGDTATHKAIKRYHPAGAEILQKGKLHVSGKVYGSDQYPAYLGMLKMVQDGLAEELNGGGYYIKKEIAAYPIGFQGKMATRFLFVEGVVLPGNSAGLSCIQSETATRTLDMSPLNCQVFNRR